MKKEKKLHFTSDGIFAVHIRYISVFFAVTGTDFSNQCRSPQVKSETKLRYEKNKNKKKTAHHSITQHNLIVNCDILNELNF